jgi:hypothetical protein
LRTNIKIDTEYLEILKDLIKSGDDKSQKDYLHAMITYFKETGIDPTAKTRSTADELSRLRNTVISFIREQEKTKLDPIINKLNETFEFLLNYFKNEAVTKADIQSLITVKSPSTSVTTHKEPEMQVINDEKYQNLVKHTRNLFNDFAKSFKSSAFGGYSIEKAVFEKYKSLFEKL